MPSRLFSKEMRSQEQRGNRDYARLFLELEEDVLHNAKISHKDFDSVISLLQEEAIYLDNDLHRFLAIFWSLPGVLNDLQRRQFCDAIVHATIHELNEENALVLGDAVARVSKKSELESYLDELGKKEGLVNAVNYVRKSPLYN